MSKKALLTEEVTRKMMKLANIGSLSDKFINETYSMEEEEMEEGMGGASYMEEEDEDPADDAPADMDMGDEPMDMDRLAYAVAHPSMLRRSLFRVTEFMMDYEVDGYGRINSDIEVPANTMYIPPMFRDNGYRTMEDALETVRGHWDQMAARGESSDAA